MLAESRPPIECSPDLLNKARAHPPIKTAIVNAINDVVMQSSRDAHEAGLIEPILIGNPDDIKKAADEIGWDIAAFEILPSAPADEADAANVGTQAVQLGAGAIMKGHLHTDVFMRAILNKEAGLRTGRPFSHVGYITIPGREGGFFLTDVALNPAPDMDMRKDIIRNAVQLAKSIGISRPKVALLSAVEIPSEKIPSSVEAEQIRDWARLHLPEIDVDGPLAFDLCVSEEAVRIKGLQSPVAGAADIIVVPEIVAGNALFKMMAQYANACTAGIVMGAKVPILLTSRSDAPAARLASAALASLAGNIPS